MVMAVLIREHHAQPWPQLGLLRYQYRTGAIDEGILVPDYLSESFNGLGSRMFIDWFLIPPQLQTLFPSFHSPGLPGESKFFATLSPDFLNDTAIVCNSDCSMFDATHWAKAGPR